MLLTRGVHHRVHLVIFLGSHRQKPWGSRGASVHPPREHDGARCCRSLRGPSGTVGELGRSWRCQCRSHCSRNSTLNNGRKCQNGFMLTMLKDVWHLIYAHLIQHCREDKTFRRMFFLFPIKITAFNSAFTKSKNLPQKSTTRIIPED